MFISKIPEKTSVFIDAIIFVYHFTANSRFNQACTNFLERVEKKELQGQTSVSIIQEVTHRIMIEEAAVLLPDIKTKDLVKHLKSHPDIVRKLEINNTIPVRINLLNVEIFPLDQGIIERSQQFKLKFGLLSNDALILQTMKDHNIVHLVSNDNDFKRIDFITVYEPESQSIN
ncbi:MAG: type II toxin-antitoxin system VapC family toxin [Nitrospiria bacterium]